MRLSLLVSCILILSCEGRARLTDQDFAYFKSATVEPLRPEMAGTQKSNTEYPWIARWLQVDALKIDRTGRSTKILSATDFTKKCSLYSWSKECDKNLQTFWQDPLTNSYGTMMLAGPIAKHPFARPVYFHLPNKVKLKGILAWRGDFVKRPLIIFRGGIFSNTKDFAAEKYLFQQLFEQSNFNFILLQSLTGPEFPEDNNQYSIGGYDEGLQNYYLAQALLNPGEPMAKIISDIHIMGVSFGGHGVLFTAILNELNKKNIASFMAFCPLLNIKETFEFHQAQGSIWFINFWSKDRMPSVFEIYPKIEKNNFLPSLFFEIAKNYSQPLIGRPDFRLPPGYANKKTYWELNNFNDDLKVVQTPTVIVATKMDPLVPYVLNSGKIESNEINTKGANIKLVSLDSAYHCSLPVAYDWKGLAVLFQDYVYKNSQFVGQKFEKQFPVKKLSSNTKIVYEVGYEDEKVVLDFYFDSKFFSDLQVSLDPSEFGFVFKGSLDNDEKSILRRWLYQNLEISAQSDRLLITWLK